MGKKIRKVLKGVAITGAAIGHASVFGDANLAFAHEADETLHVPSGEYTLEVENEVVQEAPIEVGPQPVEVIQEAPVPTTDEPEVKTAEQEAPAAEQEPFDASIYNTSEQAAEAKEVAEGELATAEQNLAEEVQIKTDAENAKTEAETEKAQVENQLAEKQTAFNEAGYGNDGVAEQEDKVAKKILAEAEARQAIVVNPKSTYLETKTYYKPVGRPLAKEMIKYTLLLNGEVTADTMSQVSFGEWFDNNSYENKHFCVRYINTSGELCEKYFDYVTIDKDGNSMFKTDSRDKTDDIAENVYGINVVEKTPTYKYYAEGDEPTTFKYYEATEENRQHFANEINKTKTMKIVNVGGKDYIVPQRDGWQAGENGSVKGTDYYTKHDYEEDVANRSQLTEEINALTAKINELTETIESLKETILIADGNIAVIQQEIQTIEAKIEVLENRVQELVAQEQRAAARPATQESSSTQQTVTSTVNVNLTVDNVVTKAAAGVQQTDFDEPAAQAPVAEAVAVEQPVVEAIEEVQAPLAVVDVEVPEDKEDIVNIQDQEVAKAADLSKEMAKWNGSTLPLVGALAGALGIGKVRKETKENKE